MMQPHKTNCPNYFNSLFRQEKLPKLCKSQSFLHRRRNRNKSVLLPECKCARTLESTNPFLNCYCTCSYQLSPTHACLNEPMGIRNKSLKAKSFQIIKNKNHKRSGKVGQKITFERRHENGQKAKWPKSAQNRVDRF